MCSRSVGEAVHLVLALLVYVSGMRTAHRYSVRRSSVSLVMSKIVIRVLARDLVAGALVDGLFAHRYGSSLRRGRR